MTAIPATTPSTVAAMYAAIEAGTDTAPRAHLGASVLGTECRRALWYAFRWCSEPVRDGRLLRLFRRGQLEEEQLVRDLRAAGVTVHDRDDNGEQFRFSDIGGHVGGSMDGAVLGLKEAPKTWHVLETKTSNTKAFNALVKHGVAKEKPLHMAQMQLYMKWSGMERAYYLVVCKDTDELYAERVKFDAEAADKLLAKARAIVTAPLPLERISEKPEYFGCKFCDARKVCHEKRLPPPSCRTCCHATPELDGDARWSCAFHGRDLPLNHQRMGCPDHVYIPELVPFEFVGGDESANCAEYKRGGGTFRNGTGDANCYASAELFAMQADDFAFMDDKSFMALRNDFGARVERVEPPQEFDDWEQVRAALPLPGEAVAAGEPF